MTSIDFDRPNNVIHTCLGKVFGDEGFRVDQLNQQAHINKVTELESWGLLSAAKQRAFSFGQLIQPIREGSDEREASSQLFGRLSLNLMRGNALMLSSRHQDEDIPLAEIDGVE